MIHTTRARLDQIIALRTRVLRPHFAPGQLAHFEGDEEDHTWHAALWSADELLGCLTMMRRAFTPQIEAPKSWCDARHHTTAWQLRGMAVDDRCRGMGHGRRLLDFAIGELEPGMLIWCNARQAAMSLYARAGFEPVGDLFELPHIGPHAVMGRLV